MQPIACEKAPLKGWALVIIGACHLQLLEKIVGICPLQFLEQLTTPVGGVIHGASPCQVVPQDICPLTPFQICHCSQPGIDTVII